MTGDVLYRMYQHFAESRDLGMDPWDELTELDQLIWEDLAEWIRSTE
jgi:hypothetical protein